VISDDIIPLLEQNGIGTFGTDLFWGDMPSEPDSLVTFYESPGPSGTYAKDGPAGTEGRLQVLSRAGEYEYANAMQKALDVYALLDDLRETLFGTSYHFRALGRPFDVGSQDGAGRTIISTNYAVFIFAS
jgi:hypothetical protein